MFSKNHDFSVAHFLITRFNLRDEDFNSGVQLTQEWLDYRFDLFEKFCLPTVAGQTNQNFQWLVMFDSETPESARSRIRGYQQFRNFVPVFVDAGTKQSARKSVASRLASTPDILITTRLDSDDGICNTFIDDVQRRARVDRPTVLEFPKGYVWKNGRLHTDSQPRNPFLSLVEPLTPGAEFRTVLSVSHGDIEKLGEVRQIAEAPAWLQVIHGRNIENRVRGIRCRSTDLLSRFTIRGDQLPSREGRFGYEADKARSIAWDVVRRAVGAVRRFT